MGTLLIILGIYLLYKFIVDFVIPVYKASKRVQERFRQMQQNMNDQSGSHAASSVNQNGTGASKANPKEYIDFEEIKE